MMIRPGMEEDYQKGYNNNLDEYGHAIYTFAERWAELMENDMKNTNDPSKTITENAEILFEQAGVQKKLTQSGLWFATAPEEELRRMAEQNPSILQDWDEHYGDRMVKLVFIGQNLDREQLTRDLAACLETT